MRSCKVQLNNAKTNRRLDAGNVFLLFLLESLTGSNLEQFFLIKALQRLKNFRKYISILELLMKIKYYIAG